MCEVIDLGELYLLSVVLGGVFSSVFVALAQKELGILREIDEGGRNYVLGYSAGGIAVVVLLASGVWGYFCGGEVEAGIRVLVGISVGISVVMVFALAVMLGWFVFWGPFKLAAKFGVWVQRAVFYVLALAAFVGAVYMILNLCKGI